MDFLMQCFWLVMVAKEKQREREVYRRNGKRQ